ncbi:coiled-coil domain-containing protein 33-like [Sinocyclocheilus grahami]|uniref:coiled-coil domain-containing protein 33-like n=1 Tax=Sinocyclocheilus grahami TaxID=75366 RepID=UPI0007AD0FC2|nr:PREDICTED: coiled-coil domain-containing protein 33-like [Sinocyclocheilus grahami]
MQNSEKPPNEPASAQMERGSYDLPSHDALSKILPEYLHLLKKLRTQTRTESVPQKKSKSQLNRTFDVQSPLKSPPMPDFEDDPHAGEVTEHQTKELENYRAAMHKMADDILALRSQVSALESENSQLRRDLSLHQDLTLLDDTDTDVMTKSEIADRIDAEELKRREIEPVLAAENSRLREELQRLRNLPPPVIIQQPVQTHQPFSDSEKLELLTQLARAEGRIQTLEQQV